MGNPDGATPKHILDKMVEAAQKPINHRYFRLKRPSALRKAIANWYRTRYDVDLDPGTETIVTIGSKKASRICASRSWTPTTPSWCPTRATRSTSTGRHRRGACGQRAHSQPGPVSDGARKSDSAHDAPAQGADRQLPLQPDDGVCGVALSSPPGRSAREFGFYLIHDLAYADIAFDGYKPPSVMQVPGAKDVAVEFFTLSKSYNMPGWRVGFMVGNQTLVAALGRLKSYFDYGTLYADSGSFDSRSRRPPGLRGGDLRELQKTPRCACRGPEPRRMAGRHAQKRRCSSGRRFRSSFGASARWNSASSSSPDAKVAVSPGIGFGEYGDGHVRFSLIENEERTPPGSARHQDDAGGKGLRLRFQLGIKRAGVGHVSTFSPGSLPGSTGYLFGEAPARHKAPNRRKNQPANLDR